MTHFWPLTFAMIGYWFLVGVVGLIRLPKTHTATNIGLNRQPMPD
jgi:hypothetical protein